MTLGEVRQALCSRLSRPSYWVAFGLAVLAFLVYIFLGWYEANPRPSFHVTMGLGLVASAGFYFTFIWLSPMPWQWDGRPGRAPEPGFRTLVRAFLVVELLAVLLVLLQSGVGVLMGEKALGRDVYILNLCFQGPALCLVGGLLGARERLEHEREEMRQRTDAVMAEHLKGQIHPHVLFNTLNGLAELMQQDRAAADNLVEAMSGFLHRVLEASQRPAWDLVEERSLAEDYLRMEATRLGDRLRVVWDWDPAMDGHPVLPLLLQPLVENAVKHGINPAGEGGELRLVGRREAEALVLEVHNTGAIRPPSRGRRGLGLPNLRRRLELAYGCNVHFELVTEQPGWTTGRIRVNLNTVPRL